MTSPISIGTTAIVVAPINKRRSIIRFQNTGKDSIFIKKIPITGNTSIVSDTNFEVELFPESASSKEGGQSFETNSIASFMAISSAAGNALAVYETNKV